MPYLKKHSVQFFLAIVITLEFTGCHLFDNAQKALNRYCPNFPIGLDSVDFNEYTNFDLSSRKRYTIKYDSHDEGFVEQYFHNKDNGFYHKKGNNFYKKDIDDEEFLEDDDDALGKLFKRGNNSAVVIFNQTKKSITIIEFFRK
jgi:hypothetical protein